MFKHTMYIDLCFSCYNTSYTIFQCSLHAFGSTTTLSSGWLVIKAWEEGGQKMRALICKTSFSCNRIHGKYFLSFLTETEDDAGCSAGEDEEKQPRELCMETGKHHCRMAREILERGHFWNVLDIWY